MTIDISNNAARVNYTVASGVTQTSFSVPFEFFNDSDLSVYVDDVLKTITTHYTVSGGDGSTGTITMSVTGTAGGSTVVISRSIAIERTSDFQTGVDINRAALNTQLDTLTAIAADNQDKANRSITAPNSEVNPVLELPDADTRKGKLIGFNETTGNIELSATLADGNTLASISGDIATLADIEDGTDATDAIQTVAGISSNVTTVAGVSANVTTVAGNTTNINTVAGNDANITTVADNVSGISIVSDDIISVVAVAINAANINTVAADGADIGTVATSIASVDTAATNIASINTNATNITDIQNASANAATATTQAGIATTQAGIATTKASEAATSETNAATSETNAATSETNASTSETNAATSATDAATSATNASGSAGAALNFQTQAGIYSSNAASSASSALSSKNSASSFATNSANSATSASNSASTATTKASEAAASETAAEAAKVAAEAALDEFTDIYLGAKASDPTTDNDGNALTAGDQYFNTTINVLKIYNGSAWQAAAIDSSGFVETTGDTMTGNLSFGDNDKAIFGAGSDLEIYHDGSNSYVQDAGSGNLYLRQNGTAVIIDDGTNNLAAFNSTSGESALYYGGSGKKLATTSTGVDITGTLTSDGLTVDTDAYRRLLLTYPDNFTSKLQVGFSNFYVQGSATNDRLTIANNSSGQTHFENQSKTSMVIDNSGDISFYDSAGSSQSFFWDASAESLGIGTTSVTSGFKLDVVGDARFSDVAGDDGVELGWSAGGSAGFVQAYDRGASAFRDLNLNNAVTIDSSGNVGIGVVPTNRFDVTSSAIVVSRFKSSAGGSGARAIHSLSGNGNSVEGLVFISCGSTSTVEGGANAATIRNSENAPLIFGTNNTERMRINSSGNVLFGCVSFPSASVAGFAVTGTSSGNASSSGASTAAYNHLLFYNGNGLVGYVSTSGSSTTYSTSSDYRLKENVVDLTGATDRIKQIPVHRFNFIADPDTTVDGFLAHEVQDIVPEAITGTKDAMRDEEYEVTPAVLDDDGNVVTEAVMGTRSVPDYQGIDQSKLVPLLTAALQEALTKIDALETRITALEG